MNKEEAEIIVRILATADWGCSNCVSDLFRQFNSFFKGFEYILDAKWLKDFSDVEYDWRKRPN